LALSRTLELLMRKFGDIVLGGEEMQRPSCLTAPHVSAPRRGTKTTGGGRRVLSGTSPDLPPFGVPSTPFHTFVQTLTCLP
jgi:hypothetical protein